MSFGFSIGDIAATAQLAHRLRKQYSEAPSQFKSVSDECVADVPLFPAPTNCR
jgi:hypothetical protein